MDIQGAGVLVTGGGSGLGRAIAEAILSRGARVAIHYFSSEHHAHDLENGALARGCKATTHQADLSSPGAIRALVRAVEQTSGPIDILINNAAILRRTPFGHLTARLWDETMNLNLRAVALLSAHVAPGMLQRRRGKIINIGDLAGIEPWPAYIAHAAAKAGVHHVTRCLALALAPSIQVNAVVPGLVDPPPGWSEQRIERYRKRILGGAMTTSEEIAAAVLSLVSNDAVTGQILVVDRGQHLSF
jgi:3-oxoacyl-[acyl-carrier protein] reductase